jgi:hypothetical protein
MFQTSSRDFMAGIRRRPVLLLFGLVGIVVAIALAVAAVLVTENRLVGTAIGGFATVIISERLLAAAGKAARGD